MVMTPQRLHASDPKMLRPIRITGAMLTFPSSRRPSAGLFFIRDLGGLAARGHKVSLFGASSWLNGKPVTDMVRTEIQTTVRRHFSLPAIRPLVAPITDLHFAFAEAALEQPLRAALEGSDVLFVKFMSSIGLLRFAPKDLPAVISIGEGPESITRRLASTAVRRRAQLFLPRARCIEVRSEQVADIISRLVPRGPEIAVVPSGVDLDFFQTGGMAQARHRLGLPIEQRVVSHVGTNVASKGGARLARAVQQISNCVCVVAGPGWPKGRIDESTIGLGTLDPRGVRDLLQASNAFGLPSESEGMPNALLEAMACGVPTITGARHYSDFLQDDVHCIKVDPLDMDAIRNALMRLLDDRQVAARIVSNALDRVATFGLTPRIERLEQLLASSPAKSA